MRHLHDAMSRSSHASLEFWTTSNDHHHHDGSKNPTKRP